MQSVMKYKPSEVNKKMISLKEVKKFKKLADKVEDKAQKRTDTNNEANKVAVK